MYRKFFGLKEKPFMVTPDPAFFFLGKEHQEALDHLLYGIENREGFIVVTGDVGTGKTILCRILVNELNEKDIKTALILNPAFSEIELLKAIVEDLGIGSAGDTKKEITDSLNRFLLEQLSLDKNVVVIIDEAQDLLPEVLEEIRLLSNLETEKAKLLQIVLVGQLELENLLDLPGLKQLKQRVAIRFQLHPLTRAETEKYIYHRLTVAGSKGQVSFAAKALTLIFEYSKGIPRLINLVSEKALLSAYADQTSRITARMVKRAIESLEGKKKESALHSIFADARIYGTIALAVAFILGGILGGKILGPPSKGVPDERTTIPLRKPAEKKALSAGVDVPAPAGKIASPNLGTTAAPPKTTTRRDLRAPTIEPATETAESGLENAQIVREKGKDHCSVESLQTMLKLWGNDEEELAEAASVWGNEPQKDFGFREKAKDYGLEATILETTVSQLRAFNYPCIVKLKEEHNPRSFHWAVLMGLDGDQAILGSPKLGRMNLSVSDLRNTWLGTAIILWQNPDGIKASLRRGGQGEEVKRFQQRLKEVGYFQNMPITGYYSEYTELVTRDFQERYGLKVDGIAGVRTLMVLYRVLGGDSIPRLSSGQG